MCVDPTLANPHVPEDPPAMEAGRNPTPTSKDCLDLLLGCTPTLTCKTRFISCFTRLLTPKRFGGSGSPRGAYDSVLKSGKLSCELELYLPFGVLALKEECVFMGESGDDVKDGGGTVVMAGVEGRIGERMVGGVLGGDMGAERPMLTMDHWSGRSNQPVFLSSARARLLSLSSGLPLEKSILVISPHDDSSEAIVSSQNASSYKVILSRLWTVSNDAQERFPIVDASASSSSS